MSAKMPIDVVITWVDGSDPKHAKKRAAYTPGGVRIADKPSTRFAHDGEVYFCIASILKYAPFVRKIWIVTDDQSPENLGAFAQAGLCSKDFIEVVGHTVVFRGFENNLPTFNSQTIETVLWRIPDLAEHFVAFNDDFFVNSPIELDDWFTNGRPVFGGRWELQAGEELYLKWRRFQQKLRGKAPNVGPTSKMAQVLGARLAGLKHWVMTTSHLPRPMRKSVQELYFARNKAVLEQQVVSKFRDHGQFLPFSLANHLEMREHGVRPARVESEAYLSPGKSRGHFRKNLEMIASDGRKFACVQSLDQFRVDDRHQIFETLIKKFGTFLPAEVRSELRPE